MSGYDLAPNFAGMNDHELFGGLTQASSEGVTAGAQSPVRAMPVAPDRIILSMDRARAICLLSSLRFAGEMPGLRDELARSLR